MAETQAAKSEPAEIVAILEERLAERTAELKATKQALEKEIQERTSARQELEERQRLLNLVIDHVPALISYVDRHRRYRFVNKRYEQVWEMSRSELAGKTVQEILGPEGYAAAEHHIAAALAGETVSYEDAFEYPGLGRRWMSVQYVPDRDPAGDLGGDVHGLVSMVIDVTERKLVEEQIVEYQERLQALASQLTLSEERERRRIARELHDEVGQKLTFARMALASAREMTSEAQREAILDDVSSSVRQAIGEIRDLVFDLSSPLMNEVGLAAALAEWLEDQVGKKHGLRVKLINDGRRLPLDDDVRAMLFRSTRELLTNVVKHARAKSVIVRLEGEGTTVRITVEDDGLGFDLEALPRATERGSGFGLFSIRERMAALGGSLELFTAPGQGCKAILMAPATLQWGAAKTLEG